MTRVSRRELLSGAAGMAGMAALSSSVHAAPADAVEYGLQPGLIYLNTGSLGPAPRSVLEAVTKTWNELETNPVVMSLISVFFREKPCT